MEATGIHPTIAFPLCLQWSWWQCGNQHIPADYSWCHTEYWVCWSPCACNGQFLAIVAQIERLFFFHTAQILYLAHPQHHASTISSVRYGIQWSYNGLDHIQNIARTLPLTSIQMWHGHHYHNIVSHPLPFIIIQHFLWEPSYKPSNNIDVWYQHIACSIPKRCHAQEHVVEHFSMHPPFSCICYACQWGYSPDSWPY